MLRTRTQSGNSSCTHGVSPTLTKSTTAHAYPENAIHLGMTCVRSAMVDTAIMKTPAIRIA